VIVPEVVMLATWLVEFSVNHIVSLGPSVIPRGAGLVPGMGRANLWTRAPEVPMTPMALEPCSVNQISPPGPGAMASVDVTGEPTPEARRSAAGRANSCTAGPAACGVISPMRSTAGSVNHKRASGPSVMASRPGTEPAEAGTG